MKIKIIFCALAVILGLCVYFCGLGDYGLLDPDEGRYSEIPREMLESGDFITPRLNYVKYFEKPVLYYWLTAGVFKMFGQNEFTSRLTPVLSGLLTCLITGILAFKITRSKKSAWLAGLMLGSSFLWFACSRLNIIDITFSLFFTLSLFSFRYWLEDLNKKFWLNIFYIFMALAVLSKGLAGVVLPGGIAVIYAILSGQAKGILTKIFSPVAIIIFFVINAVWFAPVMIKNPDFFNFFFIHEHFLRYTTTIHKHEEAVYFFIPVMLGAVVPFTGLVFDALRAVAGKCDFISKHDGIFLGTWLLLPVIFFSFSGSKLVTYILPSVPPLIILSAGILANINQKIFKHVMILNTLLILPLALTGLILPLISNDESIKAMAAPIFAFGLSLLVFYIVSFKLLKANLHVAFLLCLIAFIGLYVASPVFKSRAAFLSQKDTAEIIQREINLTSNSEDVKIIAFQKLLQGMNFYLARRTITADILDELEFGATVENEREQNNGWFINTQELQKLWSSQNRVVAVARANNSERISEILSNPVRKFITSADVIYMNF